MREKSLYRVWYTNLINKDNVRIRGEFYCIEKYPLVKGFINSRVIGKVNFFHVRDIRELRYNV